MEIRNYLILAGVITLLAGLPAILSGSGDDNDSSILPPPRNGPITFTNVSKEVGLSHVNGNFFSWGDFDNDDHQDLLVNGKRLFRNSGPPDFVFTEVTSHAGIDRPVNSGVFGDYDNDGWLDIFCGGGYGSRDHPETPDILWRNNRDGTFTEVTELVGGLSDTFPTVAGGWADIDRDGHIDLYMVNYENGTYQGYPDNFWYNNGDGTFKNGTISSGMDESDVPLQGRGISFTDFDNDGFIDAYVSNYRITPNYLYHNLKDGTMEEVSALYGVDGHGNDHPVTQDGPYYGHSLGSSWGDMDNDGDMDLWVTNLAHKDAWRGPICDDSYLYKNLGPEDGYQFTDVREGSGIPVKGIPGGLLDGDELMVSSALADHDNDGDLDLFIPQVYNLSYAYSFLYSNEGDMTFTDASGDSGIRVWNTYGSAWCDYNEDGWIDLVTGGGNWDENAGVVDKAIHLFRNDGASIEPDKKWLEVDLTGRDSNNAAIGTRVTVEVDTVGDGEYDHLMIREVNGGTAAQGQQDSMLLHFGLGESVHGIKMTTKWPMGKEIVMEGLEPNKIIREFEPTEPVILNMTLTNFEMDDQGAKIDLVLENPTIFPISYIDFILMIQEKDGSTEYRIVHDRSIGPGRNEITLMAPGMPEDTIANISLEIDRSFPPLAYYPVIDHYHDPLTNILPIARLQGPAEVSVGETFTIDGKDSFDTDGTIVSYNFDLGDGTISGWQGSSTFSHTYTSPGEYSARLSVRDDKGSSSLEDAILTIEASGSIDTAPVAMIDYIKPSSVEVGERVRMSGHGIPYEDRTIAGFEWHSSIDGILGDTSYIAIEILSPGTHMITFNVVDSANEWSLPAEGEVEVFEIVIEELWVTIDPPSVDGPYSGPIKFTGSAGPVERVEFVEVRLDSGLWGRARTVPEWSFEVDCKKLDPGPHRIDARCFGDRYYSNSYASLEFEVVSDEDEEDEVSQDPGNKNILDKLKVSPLVIAGSLIVMVLLLILIILLMFNFRKRRVKKWSSNVLGREHALEGPEVLLPEKNDKDIQVVQATIIE